MFSVSLLYKQRITGYGTQLSSGLIIRNRISILVIQYLNIFVFEKNGGLRSRQQKFRLFCGYRKLQ